MSDRTVVLADIAEKALRQVRDVVVGLLSEKVPAEQAQKSAELLTSGTWTHDYPITSDEARKLGLPVKTEVPVQVYRLMSLFPQTRQRRPSVEYIPSPRHAARNHRSFSR